MDLETATEWPEGQEAVYEGKPVYHRFYIPNGLFTKPQLSNQGLRPTTKAAAYKVNTVGAYIALYDIKDAVEIAYRK
jgi:hypothetical protein